MKRLIGLCLAAALFSACGSNETENKTETTEAPAVENKLDKLSWVLGTWEMGTPEGTFTEHWEETNDSTYAGRGTMVSPKGDTLFSEQIRLEQSGGVVYYKPVVSGQNNGQETVFTEKSLSANEVVFENPAHDFPQRIIYKRPSDSTLYARIEGKVEGKDRQEEYQYKRK